MPKIVLQHLIGIVLFSTFAMLLPRQGICEISPNQGSKS